MTHRARSVVNLSRLHLGRPNRPVSHALLSDDGTYTIQRGYLLDAGIVTSDAVDDFDSFLRAHFPNLGWSGKYYYLNSSGPPDPRAFRDLLNWLTAQAASEPRP